LSSSKILKGKV